MQGNQWEGKEKNNVSGPLKMEKGQLLALKELAQKEPDNCHVLKKLGRMLVESQKFDEAVEVHQRVHDLEPHDPRNSNSLGVILMIAGYQPQAIEYLERAVSLAPNNLVFKANLGKAYMMAREWREALECFNRVLSNAGTKNTEQLMALREECLANISATPNEVHF